MSHLPPPAATVPSPPFPEWDDGVGGKATQGAHPQDVALGLPPNTGAHLQDLALGLPSNTGTADIPRG